MFCVFIAVDPLGAAGVDVVEAWELLLVDVLGLGDVELVEVDLGVLELLLAGNVVGFSCELFSVVALVVEVGALPDFSEDAGVVVAIGVVVSEITGKDVVAEDVLEEIVDARGVLNPWVGLAGEIIGVGKDFGAAGRAVGVEGMVVPGKVDALVKFIAPGKIGVLVVLLLGSIGVVERDVMPVVVALGKAKGLLLVLVKFGKPVAAGGVGVADDPGKVDTLAKLVVLGKADTPEVAEEIVDDEDNPGIEIVEAPKLLVPEPNELLALKPLLELPKLLVELAELLEPKLPLDPNPLFDPDELLVKDGGEYEDGDELANDFFELEIDGALVAVNGFDGAENILGVKDGWKVLLDVGIVSIGVELFGEKSIALEDWTDACCIGFGLDCIGFLLKDWVFFSEVLIGVSWRFDFGSNTSWAWDSKVCNSSSRFWTACSNWSFGRFFSIAWLCNNVNSFCKIWMSCKISETERLSFFASNGA